MPTSIHFSANSAPCKPHEGLAHIKNRFAYNGVSTPIKDREVLGIRGLIPAAYLPLEVNVQRCMVMLRSKPSNLDKYIFLCSIQDTNERLFFAMMVTHTAELMPIVYTPTVGETCQKFSHIYHGTFRGLYISLQDSGNIRSILDNWPTSAVTTIVVTDGERILGLGDLGVNGMGIPIGKLALYTACAGIHPARVLPVHLDVGTNNEDNLADPYYLGLRQRRERGPAYDDLIQEFFDACQDKFGRSVLIQFEDFGNKNAFRLLEKFRNRACTFNDDIQGTAAVALAGLLTSTSITGIRLEDHTILFNGAGEAAVGIANLVAYAISKESNVSIFEARKRIFLVDSKGLVTGARLGTLQPHKLLYAHDHVPAFPDLKSSLEYVQPTVLIGVSAVPKAFDKNVCEQMAKMNQIPVIFALSNPTSKAECTAQEAYEWTDGRVVFCSGSPFQPVTLSDGRHFVPGQGMELLILFYFLIAHKTYLLSLILATISGNNAYIFPGVGLGAVASGSTKITDEDMYLAAKCLSSQVSDKELCVGCLYPPLDKIREVSVKIASVVAKNAYQTKVATRIPEPQDLEEYCKSIMYDPRH